MISSPSQRPLAKRLLFVGVGLLAVAVAALCFVPRFRDARVTLHAVLVRAGFVLALDRENIQFQSAGATLSGTVVFPTAAKPVAAIVLIHGSGPATRMLWLAHLFASKGIAVMTYDKRGVGRSAGTFVGGMAAATAANLELLARDAAAGAAAIAGHTRLRETSIGLVGFSQGGWSGPLAAAGSPDVDFMAFFSGPVATTCEEGHFSDLAEGDSAFWQTHTREQVAEHMKLAKCGPEDLDPAETLMRLRIPGFWALGAQDNLMPVDLSTARLDALIAAGQSQFSYRVYPGMGHEVITFDFSRLSLSTPFHDAVAWIEQVAR